VTLGHDTFGHPYLVEPKWRVLLATIVLSFDIFLLKTWPALKWIFRKMRQEAAEIWRKGWKVERSGWINVCRIDGYMDDCYMSRFVREWLETDPLTEKDHCPVVFPM
jgi:hypothetical protein